MEVYIDIIIVLYIVCACATHSACVARGNLMTRSLVDVVRKEHFVLNSEYLRTLLVVVPK